MEGDADAADAVVRGLGDRPGDVGAVALIVVGVLGKLAAGYAPWWFRGQKLLIGVAMVPRGEVGLIFAQMGLATGVLTGETFGALMLMVVVTTFLAPPLLGIISARRVADEEGAPDERGINDLVMGSHRRTEPSVRPREL